MGGDEAVTGHPDHRLVAGIGFRRGAGAGEIVRLVAQALAAVGARDEALAALATAQDRAADPAFLEAAAELGVPVLGVGPDALRAVEAGIVTRSERVRALRGIGSVAEGAALAAAGRGGRLALPRIAGPAVTCALARIAGARPEAEWHGFTSPRGGEVESRAAAPGEGAPPLPEGSQPPHPTLSPSGRGFPSPNGTALRPGRRSP